MSKHALPGRTANRLLDRLPENELKRLLPSLETISLPHGYELCRQNGVMAHVYFPTSGVCSVVSVTDEGRVVEAATIGNEGMIGIPVMLRLDFSPSRIISQVAGAALRMPAPAFLKALEPAGALDILMRQYIAFSLHYAYQTVACNALHSLEERMCRWLLMTHERVGKEKFMLAQEFLSEMLGVRQASLAIAEAS